MVEVRVENIKPKTTQRHWHDAGQKKQRWYDYQLMYKKKETHRRSRCGIKKKKNSISQRIGFYKRPWM